MVALARAGGYVCGVMGRIPRNRLGPGVFHVINRAINSRWILEHEEDRQFLVELLCRFKGDYPINIYHWTVMSSHFHLAIETLTVPDLSAYVGKVTRRYTMYYHQRYGGSGPLWVRRFKSVLVQKEGYLIQLGRYIERNAVRAKLVERPWEYKFGSAAGYVSGTGDGLVDNSQHPIWIDLSKSERGRRRAYSTFLMKGAGGREEEQLFRSSMRVIGDRTFTANAKALRGRLTSRGRGSRRRMYRIILL